MGRQQEFQCNFVLQLSAFTNIIQITRYFLSRKCDSLVIHNLQLSLVVKCGIVSNQKLRYRIICLSIMAAQDRGKRFKCQNISVYDTNLVSHTIDTLLKYIFVCWQLSNRRYFVNDLFYAESYILYIPLHAPICMDVDSILRVHKMLKTHKVSIFVFHSVRASAPIYCILCTGILGQYN